MPVFFFTVEQQERAIVERFGKFVRVAGPGLQTKTPFVERVAGRMSLQVEQLNAEIETKTKDNVFVRVKLAVQYKVGADPQQVQDAYYKLDDPEIQIQSYAFDVVARTSRAWASTRPTPTPTRSPCTFRTPCTGRWPSTAMRSSRR